MTRYRSSPIARSRRSADSIARLRKGLRDLAFANAPVTCRQVFYRAVAAGLVEKREGEYKHTVCRLLVELRRSGALPYNVVADVTRWMRKPQTFGSLAAALAATQRDYRRALWQDQDAYVEVWLEKDALAGVLVDVTREWDVPLMVSRGFASLSFLHAAAEQIIATRKPAHLYYVGDHDPSGVLIDRKIEQTLRELAPRAEIHFRRIAVLEAQIAEWDLPSRPTKDSKHRSGFIGNSVEADAIEPATLRELVRAAIVSHVDITRLHATQRAERAEKDTLAAMIRRGLPTQVAG